MNLYKQNHHRQQQTHRQQQAVRHHRHENLSFGSKDWETRGMYEITVGNSRDEEYGYNCRVPLLPVLAIADNKQWQRRKMDYMA
jgi:hypothetical protein